MYCTLLLLLLPYQYGCLVSVFLFFLFYFHDFLGMRIRIQYILCFSLGFTFVAPTPTVFDTVLEHKRLSACQDMDFYMFIFWDVVFSSVLMEKLNFLYQKTAHILLIFCRDEHIIIKLKNLIFDIFSLVTQSIPWAAFPDTRCRPPEFLRSRFSAIVHLLGFFLSGKPLHFTNVSLSDSIAFK